MTDRTVTIAEGRIAWGYHQAALLRSCVVTRTDGAWSLTGTITNSDVFRLSQRPLTFTVVHQRGRWSWPIETLQMEGVALTARLGPKE